MIDSLKSMIIQAASLPNNPTVRLNFRKAAPWIGLALATIASAAYFFRCSNKPAHYHAPNEGETRWRTLPKPIIQTIFSHLDAETRKTSRLVCRRWNTALTERSTLLPPLIDLRQVPELVHVDLTEANALQKAKLAFRRLSTLVDLMGGWDQFYSLPEFNEGGPDWPYIYAPSNLSIRERMAQFSEEYRPIHNFLHRLDAFDLPAPIVRGRTAGGIPFIILRYITHLGSSYPLVITQSDDWKIQFHFAHVITMDPTEDGKDLISIREEHLMRDMIPTPKQFLQQLLRKPPLSHASFTNDSPLWTRATMIPCTRVRITDHYNVALWNGSNEMAQPMDLTDRNLQIAGQIQWSPRFTVDAGIYTQGPISKQFMDQYTAQHRIFENVFLGSVRAAQSLDPQFLKVHKMTDLTKQPLPDDLAMNGVFMAHFVSQQDKKGCSQLGICRVLRVTALSNPDPVLPNIQTHTLKLTENGFAEADAQHAFAFIDEARSWGEPLLIYSENDTSSVAALTAYLMSRCEMTLEQMLNFIKLKRSTAQLTPQLLETLKTYEH